MADSDTVCLWGRVERVHDIVGVATKAVQAVGFDVSIDLYYGMDQVHAVKGGVSVMIVIDDRDPCTVMIAAARARAAHGCLVFCFPSLARRPSASPEGLLLIARVIHEAMKKQALVYGWNWFGPPADWGERGDAVTESEEPMPFESKAP